MGKKPEDGMRSRKASSVAANNGSYSGCSIFLRHPDHELSADNMMQNRENGALI
ncbi:hypothetical protein PSE_2027 [Pseudovibrio sp. FO-BEG1]|nr:hypothetical protein PSE_2027 [Pseudovibrio sp. FO-BEG1]